MVATFVVLAAFGTTASANEDEQQLIPPLEMAIRNQIPPLGLPDPSVRFTNHWIEGGDCGGKITYVDRDSPNYGVRTRLSGLGPINNASLPSTDPDDTVQPMIPLITLIVTIAALLVAATALALQFLQGATDPWAEWTVTCKATGFGLEANGESGGPLRKVRIAFPGIPESQAGAPCEYLGEPVEATCFVPATYVDAAGLTGEPLTGASKLVWNEAEERVEYDPPLPRLGGICIPPFSAINEGQIPVQNLLVDRVMVPLGDTACAEPCIQWVEETQVIGCLPPDEEEEA